MNLFANDSQRIFEGVSFAPMMITAPFLGLATTCYAIYLIGAWALVGFAILLFLFPLQVKMLIYIIAVGCTQYYQPSITT